MRACHSGVLRTARSQDVNMRCADHLVQGVQVLTARLHRSRAVERWRLPCKPALREVDGPLGAPSGLDSGRSQQPAAAGSVRCGAPCGDLRQRSQACEPRPAQVCRSRPAEQQH